MKIRLTYWISVALVTIAIGGCLFLLSGELKNGLALKSVTKFQKGLIDDNRQFGVASGGGDVVVHVSSRDYFIVESVYNPDVSLKPERVDTDKRLQVFGSIPPYLWVLRLTVETSGRWIIDNEKEYSTLGFAPTVNVYLEAESEAPFDFWVSDCCGENTVHRTVYGGIGAIILFLCVATLNNRRRIWQVAEDKKRAEWAALVKRKNDERLELGDDGELRPI